MMDGWRKKGSLKLSDFCFACRGCGKEVAGKDVTHNLGFFCNECAGVSEDSPATDQVVTVWEPEDEEDDSDPQADPAAPTGR